MLKLSYPELFFRTIPEGFFFILASYALARKSIERNRYILSSIVLGIVIFLVRELPIQFGVHTIITIMIHVLLSVVVNKIEVIKAVSAVLLSTIIMFIAEGINVAMLDKLFKINLEVVFSNPISKLIYSSPSFIIFAVTILILYKLLTGKTRG